MAKNGKSRKRIWPVMCRVMTQALTLTLPLAAIPMGAVSAAPAPLDTQTQIDKSVMHGVTPAVKAEGFAQLELHDIPSFELVQNAAPPWPESAAVTPRALKRR